MVKQMRRNWQKKWKKNSGLICRNDLDEVKQNPLPYTLPATGIMVEKSYEKQRLKILIIRRNRDQRRRIYKSV